MADTKHTPTPWKVYEDDLDFVIAQKREGAWTHGLVCEMSRDSCNEADPHFIALACNAHADLVSALEEILAITDRDHVAWHKAHAALAKAKVTA